MFDAGTKLENLISGGIFTYKFKIILNFFIFKLKNKINV